MSDPGWVRWSQWTEQGMVGAGTMRKREMQEQLQRFEVKAREVLAETGSDHVLYGIKFYDKNDEVVDLHFYMMPLSDDEFEKEVVPLKGQQVYAIHKMK